ncbi:hypothetical protein B0T10DRAFT_464626 [Thelonectria olida]|uniref:Uncharacterized protein n=1 Tax=Thelonectria olida TaxID=1576542 RepID=A0A9P8VWM4_9HYPO|nr:hypothetical protein B0T10DRAFT_464626 [Thelonectria olida]
MPTLLSFLFSPPPLERLVLVAAGLVGLSQWFLSPDQFATQQRPFDSLRDAVNTTHPTAPDLPISHAGLQICHHGPQENDFVSRSGWPKPFVLFSALLLCPTKAVTPN